MSVNWGKKHSKESRNKMSAALKYKNGKKVLNKETGEVFDTIKCAAKSINMKHTTLIAKLTGQNTNNTSFIYLGDSTC